MLLYYDLCFADVLTDRALNLRKNLQKCCCKETMMLLYLLKETESLLIMPFLRGGRSGIF